MIRDIYIIIYRAIKHKVPLRQLIPTPGAPFDVEIFTKLLLLRNKELTTRKENNYIQRELKYNPEAKRALEDVRQTFRNERFPLVVPIKPKYGKRVAILIAVLAFAVCTYAVVRYWSYISVEREKVKEEVEKVKKEKVKEEKVKVMSTKTLHEIADMIETNYGVKVILDHEKEIAGKQFSGFFDTRKPLKDFLETLSVNGKIAYYFDKEQHLHFKEMLY
ncbi:DUF4974 domain-containing protein [Chitinophaga sp. GbtcB8]|uniref:DUF4974 domain-containing protein n=1 Tax=Chitinophaga sp. GbtcB8 TaxID=2824753 RepID=UPI001C30FDF6|nr:DUF4974 domain-containing protein [Chitinophaga sp. GbtcB8]